MVKEDYGQRRYEKLVTTTGGASMSPKGGQMSPLKTQVSSKNEV